MSQFFSSAFILDPVVPLEIEDSEGNVFTQRMTYSGKAFDEKSIKIEVPPHQGGETAFDQLTVVMHAATNGWWHLYSLKVNWIQLFPINICSGQHAVQERQPMSYHNDS